MYTNMKVPDEPSGWVKLWRLLFKKKGACKKHEWRPCIAFLHTYKEDKPARVCANCKEWEPLTDVEFFAQFGETFYSTVQRHRAEMEKPKGEPKVKKTAMRREKT